MGTRRHRLLFLAVSASCVVLVFYRLRSRRTPPFLAFALRAFRTAFRAAMGVVCCCAAGPVAPDVAREGALPNPLPPHNEWKRDLGADIGSDPTAVSRDFPRLDVYFAAPSEASPTVPRSRNAPPPSADEHTRRVVTALVGVVSIIEAVCEKPPGAPEAVAGGLAPRLRAILDDGLAGAFAAATSQGLADAFERTGMVAHETPALPLADGAATTGTEGARAEGGKSAAYGTFSAPGTPGPSRVSARGASMWLLQLFAQGTLFYPSQRMAHLLWMPWARLLRDAAWRVRVFRLSPFPEHVYVWHERAVENYVDSDEARDCPRFRVWWTLEMTASAQTGRFVDAALAVQRIEVLQQPRASEAWHARLEAFRQRAVDVLDVLEVPVVGAFSGPEHKK